MAILQEQRATARLDKAAFVVGLEAALGDNQTHAEAARRSRRSSTSSARAAIPAWRRACRRTGRARARSSRTSWRASPWRNVYCYDAARPGGRPRGDHLKDLLDAGAQATRADGIHIQDPNNANRREMEQFSHVVEGLTADEEEGGRRAPRRARGGAACGAAAAAPRAV